MKIKNSNKPKAVVWSLRDYQARRNHILVIRDVGGLGDILMQRMIFEDFKRVMPDAHITWAVPRQYLEAASHHPFVDEVVDSQQVDKSTFPVMYNITFACGRYESSIAPLSDKNRSDIWAEHCGVILARHNMHLNVSEKEKTEGRKLLTTATKTNGPILALCPISAGTGKNMLDPVMTETVLRLWQMGCAVVYVHNKQIPVLDKIGCPSLPGMGIRKWISVLAASDYVVSVDTASFHCAGGLGRPLTGIFTYCDGKIYGKHYDFVLVQKHRDNGDWPCGPCYHWTACTKEQTATSIKPCSREITVDMVMEGIGKMIARWPYKPV